MKALITGGAGFIGSHLAEALIRLGHEVVVLDRVAATDTRNLFACRAHPRFRYLQGDAADETAVATAMHGCQWVFHQAAVPSVPWSVEHPVESNRDNLDATVVLLQAATRVRVQRFVFASSSAVYGDDDRVELKGEQLPPNPLSPYALQKLTGEHYCRLFHRLQGVPTVALRYFNVYGPRQAADSAYSGVIARFGTALFSGESPVIFGDGGQSRDFIHVSDVVAANLRAAEAQEGFVAGKVFNIGTGESRSLLDLVEGLNQLEIARLQPRFAPARAGDVRHSRADIAAARDAFGHRIEMDWINGLASTVEHYRATHRLGMANKPALAA